jgi:hypothetical protein
MRSSNLLRSSSPLETLVATERFPSAPRRFICSTPEPHPPAFVPRLLRTRRDNLLWALAIVYAD